MTQTASNQPSQVPLVEALRVLAELRGNDIVVTSMGSAREWQKISRHPLDFNYVPSAMGHAPSLALGIALAQPQRHVIVLVGDGSLLMNLGTLVTIRASGAGNLTFVLFDNGVYEATGSQQTAGNLVSADFAAMATAAGFESVARFDDLIDWQNGAATILQMPGPRFVVLSVEPQTTNYSVEPREPIADQVVRFCRAVSVP